MVSYGFGSGSLAAKVARGPEYTVQLCLLATKSRFLQLQGPHFSWKQTPTRIHHLGPSKLRPEQPGGSIPSTTVCQKDQKRGLRRLFLTLTKASRTPSHCNSEKPHLLEPKPARPSGVAVNQPSFVQGERRGKYPPGLKWAPRPADILPFSTYNHQVRSK